jgi:hypothetical protein
LVKNAGASQSGRVRCEGEAILGFETRQTDSSVAFLDSPRVPTSVLGPPKQRHLDRQLLVSLENLVPLSNLYRRLDAKLLKVMVVLEPGEAREGR